MKSAAERAPLRGRGPRPQPAGGRAAPARAAARRPAGVGDVDVFGIAQEGDLATVLILPLRGGRLGDRFTFVVENAASSSPDELVLLAADERYGGPNGSVPPLVCVPAELEEGELIGELLSEWRGGRVELRVPERGKKRELLELAQTNAAHALAEARLQGERTRLRRFGALEELREVLNLESLPLRIECFDISNLGEQATRGVDGRVRAGRAEEGRLPHLRHRPRAGAGRLRVDVRGRAAAVHAARERRLGRGPATTPASPSVPNLVVIDGGKGQLSAALGALDGLDLPRVAAIGLAKRIEEVYVPGRAEPILLPPTRRRCCCCAASATRRTGSRSSTTAAGARRRAAPTRCSTACRASGRPASSCCWRTSARPPACSGRRSDELAAVPGLPLKTAREIHAFLNKTGGAGARVSGTLLGRLRGARLGRRRGRLPRRRGDPPRVAAGHRPSAARRRAPRRSASWSTCSSPTSPASASRSPISTSRRRWPGQVSHRSRRPVCASCRTCPTVRRCPTATWLGGPGGTARIARPARSARAVTLSIVVPYHRVIRADGSIGEWGPEGNAYKRRLLRHEGLHL